MFLLRFTITYIIFLQSILDIKLVCFCFLEKECVTAFFCGRAPPPILILKNQDWRKGQLKNEPKKVFILENGDYKGITYREFKKCHESDISYADRHYIPVQGMLLEVTKEVYTEFYRDKERNRYLKKLDRENGLLSLDAFIAEDGTGMDIVFDTEDIAETVIDKLKLDKLRECICLLSEEEQKLIRQHYYDEISEVELGRMYGITQQAVSKRIKKIQQKIKKLMEM